MGFLGGQGANLNQVLEIARARRCLPLSWVREGSTQRLGGGRGGGGVKWKKWEHGRNARRLTWSRRACSEGEGELGGGQIKREEPAGERYLSFSPDSKPEMLTERKKKRS